MGALFFFFFPFPEVGLFFLRCSPKDGQCDCRPHITGRSCTEPAPGHFFAPLNFYLYEAEEATPLQGLAPLVCIPLAFLIDVPEGNTHNVSLSSWVGCPEASGFAPKQRIRSILAQNCKLYNLSRAESAFYFCILIPAQSLAQRCNLDYAGMTWT